MDKIAGYRPKQGYERSLDERTTPPRTRAGGGFRAPKVRWPVPQLQLAGGKEDREVRLRRLRRTYQLMTSLVATVWPADVRPPRDPGAVSWRAAIDHISEAGDELTVIWRDEDHLEKYHHAVDLAWSGMCESGRPVIHRNGDPSELSPVPEEALW